jgi:2-amino-4-hydroxy-6-hydroxymethyldihydropteridine diphosphokinase
MMIYLLSLGSNLGRPEANLARAVELLRAGGVEVVRASSIYRTEPVDHPGQPWFLNQVLEVRTALSPLSLLKLGRSIESAMKRVRSAVKGPRTIDIDILLAGSLELESDELTIPHPRMALRNFVLVPLAEIAPGAVHPRSRKTAAQLLQECPDTAKVEKFAGPF